MRSMIEAPGRPERRQDPRFIQLIGLLLLLVAAVVAPLQAAECHRVGKSAGSLKYGIAPWTGGAAAAVWTKRVGRHFWDRECLQVSFGSAKDFSGYIRAAVAGKYDLVDTPPHIGLYLIQNHHFLPLARERFPAAQTVLFVPSDSSIRMLSELAGVEVAMPDPLAMVSMRAQRMWLADLAPAAVVRHYANHDQVIQAVLGNQAVAGVVFSPMLEPYMTSYKGRFRFIASLPSRGDGLMVAPPDQSLQRRAAMQRAILSFADSQGTLGHRWDAVTDAELQQMARDFAPEVQQLRSHFQREPQQRR